MAKKAATASTTWSTGEEPMEPVAADTLTVKIPQRKRGPAGTGKRATLLTLTDLGDHLAATFDMPKSHAKIYLVEAVALIAKSLRKGNKVRIAGLGVFEVKKRAARKGHNPGTGEPMKIKASKRVGFTVSRDLKAKL